ncbi:MAG: prepilin-type N-terminal cleavage/methylation domain-containing protein, partial [Bacilli bacterium]|nr:prepilin-type N-terminal cleavage/methylation domain-containing protein [Bacilli bacterium]
MKKCDRRKGFTLIEVLGVIVILLLLILITTPIVVNYLKKANKDAESVQEYTIKEAAKSWLSSRENISLTPVSSNDCV